MTKDEIAQVLKESRMKANFTQKQVAELLGKKQQTVASWEIGQSQPDANTLFALFDIYGLSVDDAFGFNRKKNPPALPSESLEVAEAYLKSNIQIKNIVRQALGLPLLDASSGPDMARIRHDAEAYKERIENQKVPAKK